jgi:hypothetical protein
MTTDALATTTSKESTAAAIYQSPAAILRPATARYPELGRIRAGVKVLKKPWNERDREKGIYSKMLAEGARWDDIDLALGQDDDKKSKLRPANMPFFFVRPVDCSDPGNAKRLLEMYGEKDDKGVLRLKSFPIIFYSDAWWENIDSSYICYSTNEVRFRSQIMASTVDGELVGTRTCMVPPPPMPGKRPCGVTREWSPRPNTPEYKQDGECHPDRCPQFQRKECNLNATIRGYIPGILGHGLWNITTHSWHGSSEIAKVMLDISEMIRKASGHGRLSMLNVNGTCVFWIRKVQKTIYQIDTKTGKPVKRQQYLPILDVAVDEFELYRYFEPAAIRERGRAAMALLNGENPKAITTSPIPAPPSASIPGPGSTPESATEPAEDDEIYDLGDEPGDIIDVPVEPATATAETTGTAAIFTDTTTAAPAVELREDQKESPEYAALPADERERRIEAIKEKIRVKRSYMDTAVLEKFGETNKLYKTSSLRAFEAYLKGLEILAPSLPV